MHVAVIIPTQRRAAYLDVALDTIAPQARAADADLIVVDDGPDDATARVAARYGARYVPHDAPRGLNAARNTGADHTKAGLLAYVDDDVAATPGWLDALLHADRTLGDEYGVLTGPIWARFEGRRFRTCGREGPPVTHLDLGTQDRDVDVAWGANLCVRRDALTLAGPFDASRPLYGDEQEWQDRLRAAGGGRVRYIAGAGLHHRRAGADASLRGLMRAARRRGRAARREDVAKGAVAPVRAELRTLAATAVHGPRYACPNGPVMAAHTYGRVEEALRPSPPVAVPGTDDFLSGQSGTVGGLRSLTRRVEDLALDLRPARPVPAGTPRRVLVVGVERPASRMPRARQELLTSAHEVVIRTRDVCGLGKFANLNRLLADDDPSAYDWVLAVDDDVDLPRGFLDRFLAIADARGFELCQPAHRRYSHAAWPHTRRRADSVARTTTLVEIGPVTAFAGRAKAELLPFPDDVGMGWGLDAHWATRGLEMGIVDATAVGHTQAPAGEGYSRDRALADARRFLADRPYVKRWDVA